MPKIVDHEKRKEIIAEAAWRVILKQGMKGATVRNIAKEAGLSLGALRYYFSSHEDLLIYAMELVKERVKKRVLNIALSNLPPKEKIIQMLLEFLPTNDIKKIEMEVWLEFILYFKGQKSLQNQDGIFEGITRLMAFLEAENMLKEELDKDVEIERLYALIDGLAIHAIIDPERLTEKKIKHVLMCHLEEICK